MKRLMEILINTLRPAARSSGITSGFKFIGRKVKKERTLFKRDDLEVQAIIEKGASKKNGLRVRCRRAYYLQYMILKPVHQNI